MACDKCNKKKKRVKKETVELGGKKIRIKKGALRKQLKLKPNQSFSIPQLSRLEGIPLGKTFKFNGNTFKMTKLLKQRVTLGKTLMRKYKK